MQCRDFENTEFSNGVKKINLLIIILIGAMMLETGGLTADIVMPIAMVKPYVAGVASYYSYECADLPMANGKPFDPEKRTCASWFYKFGTVLSVKSVDTGASTEVVVTDRGPNKRLVKEGRIIDLSKRAFQDICRLEQGLTRVIVTIKK